MVGGMTGFTYCICWILISKFVLDGCWMEGVRWFIGWLFNLLDDEMIGWLEDAWLSGWMIGFLDAWMLGCLDAWMLGCLDC